MNQINTVTVIGANGTMGRNISAIFASFGKAKVFMVSRSLNKSLEAKEKAVFSVRAESIKSRLVAADYSMLGDCLSKSDLIFEACTENYEIKLSVHKMLADKLALLEESNLKIICSGTSGLSITGLSECYEEDQRTRFFGMHFFNPPYSMTLCELTPTEYANPSILKDVFEYTKNILLRTTVLVKDSPAFLGNRIGFHFINEALLLAEQYKDNGGIDYIDSIFGPFTGRNMAPLVTSNFVGLDVHLAIMKNLLENTNDFSDGSFKVPAFFETLIQEGRLGRKAGEGLYKTIINDDGSKVHLVYDISTDTYRKKMQYVFPFVEQMIAYLKVGDYEKAIQILKSNHSLEATICLKGLLRYILYALKITESVGYDNCSSDDVMATGFSWCPPMALVEALGGVKETENLCHRHISEKWISFEEQKRLLSHVVKSKYDYRRFIRAKR